MEYGIKMIKKIDEHISYIVNRANRLTGLIKRTFKLLDLIL